ncbi:MAG: hypothetical protein KDB02_10925 [Acidimicrobiales bacterium]|nr:hypothetical protein [Acidimicrobiales bacterium]
MSEATVIHGIEHTELLQVHEHVPDQKPSGDCYRTAIACLLGAKDPTHVPHFVDLAPKGPWEHLRAARRWLREEMVLDLFPGDLDQAIELGVPYMLSVPSKKGPWGHIVIGKAGEVVHDPSGLDYSDAEPDEPIAWVLTTPYDPDPDAQIAAWLLEVAS